MRRSRVRPEAPFEEAGAAHRATLDEVAEVVEALMEMSREAELALRYARALQGACDAAGALPRARRQELSALVGMIESRLA